MTSPAQCVGIGENPLPPRPCNHFPPQVRDALVKASQTPITLLAPLARVRAIEKALERARATHPELFIKEV